MKNVDIAPGGSLPDYTAPFSPRHFFGKDVYHLVPKIGGDAIALCGRKGSDRRRGGGCGQLCYAFRPIRKLCAECNRRARALASPPDVLPPEMLVLGQCPACFEINRHSSSCPRVCVMCGRVGRHLFKDCKATALEREAEAAEAALRG